MEPPELIGSQPPPTTTHTGSTASGEEWRVVATRDEVVATLPRTVAFRSDNPLPAWMTAAAAAIRGAVSTHAIPEGHVLEATFTGSVPPKADVENLLLYNVGIASAALRQGVRIRTRPATGNGVTQRYASADADGARERSGSLALVFTAPITETALTSPRHLWLALRPAAVAAGRVEAVDGPVALRLLVTGWNRPVSVERIKGWVDACCAAMHCYAGPALDEVVERVAHETGVAADEVRALATTTAGSALGPYPFLAPWGTIARVHPADDRLTAIDIDVRHAEEPLAIRVELYRLETS